MSRRSRRAFNRDSKERHLYAVRRLPRSPPKRSTARGGLSSRGGPNERKIVDLFRVIYRSMGSPTARQAPREEDQPRCRSLTRAKRGATAFRTTWSASSACSTTLPAEASGREEGRLPTAVDVGPVVDVDDDHPGFVVVGAVENAEVSASCRVHPGQLEGQFMTNAARGLSARPP